MNDTAVWFTTVHVYDLISYRQPSAQRENEIDSGLLAMDFSKYGFFVMKVLLSDPTELYCRTNGNVVTEL